MAEKKKVPAVRFKGFAEEWEYTKLEDKATFSKGYGYSKSDLKSQGTPIVLYGRMYTNYETSICTIDTYADDKSGSVYSTGIEVIVPASGESAEDIVRASVVEKKGVLLGGDLNIITPNSDLNPVFLALTISNGYQQRKLSQRAQGKSVVHLRNPDLKEINLFSPQKVEQLTIGTFFRNLDNLITLRQGKYDKLVNVKKSMLEKMFPKEGGTVPDIRFAGFAREWELKIFGDLVLIQRGGSPRPIEEYLTNDINGINWVKIGDVAIESRYITSTKEKIKPEGEKKSRRVCKGDLILSNSMSFGRPYIMQIEGCIHDGWLLIRDERKVFDTEYLLQLLSSDYMGQQYKSLASGGVVNNLNSELVQSTRVFITSYNEQEKMGTFFRNLDNLIGLQEQELEKLKNIKKAMLDKLFV